MGWGNNQLCGNGGYDTLVGGAGLTCFGYTLSESEQGDVGNDTIDARGGDDSMIGGSGDDRFLISGSDALGDTIGGDLFAGADLAARDKARE